MTHDTLNDPASGDETAGAPGLDVPMLTLEELAAKTGVSVRNIRFYVTRGLVPPPIRRGRQGFYTEEHVDRLALVRELQARGFTLAAIESYVGSLAASTEATDLLVSHGLVELGFPVEAAGRAAEIYSRHGQAIAEELQELFQGTILPAYREAGVGRDHVEEVVERLKPLSLAALISAYESAMARVSRAD